jgi:cytochrome c
MDSFEWNKIFGALLGTALFVVALNILVSGFMHPHPAAKPGMEVAVVEHGPAEAPVAEVAPDWGTVLPTADIAAGEKAHQPCLTCHDFTKGGPKKIGPNLYGIVGSKHAHMEGFNYSAAMRAAADKTWGYDELNEFLKAPKTAIPGTAMNFAGISKTQNRINLIAYLRSLSDAPAAIPAPKPAAPAPAEGAPAAPGDGTEPAGELQAPAPGTAPAAPGTTPPAGAATPAPAPGPAAPANPTTTAPATTPPAAPGTTPATPAPTTPAPAKPAGGGH